MQQGSEIAPMWVVFSKFLIFFLFLYSYIILFFYSLIFSFLFLYYIKQNVSNIKIIFIVGIIILLFLSFFY